MDHLIRNIAIFAHVDAGKTSVTEQLLFHSGKIRSLGSVDKGNTQTDNLDIERQRGITISSSILSFNWKNFKINLIDTPGHIDFSSETQKAFLAIDAAILIISAVEGIQAQTEKLINLLLKNKKPFIVFINKIDRMGADSDEIIQELTNELHLDTFNMQSIHDEGSNEVKISKIWNLDNFSENTSLIETIVENNEKLLNQYFLGDQLDYNILDNELTKLTHNQQLIPIYLGSAKFDIGIDNLLDGITHYLPKPKIKDADLLGVIFKTLYQKDGKWSAIRLFSGTIKTRTQLHNASQEITEKISLIKSIDLNKQLIIEEIVAGDIALIKGLTQAKPGDFVGKLIKDRQQAKLSKPLLSVQVIPSLNDINKLVEALSILNNEDPDLEFEFIKEEREFHIKIHGEIQKEIIQSILKSRFNLNVSISNPTLIYKETPSEVAEGYVRYWMPKPCWAIMRFKIEPLETGSGIIFNSIVGVNKIKKHYQKDVEKTIPLALQQGILGWEVDDVKITLIDGEDHEMHTKSNDFSIATPMGILDGLSKAKMTLLEPILSFKIKGPTNYVGKITSELINLRAAIKSSEIKDNKVIIQGEIPLATSIDFPIKLSVITGGKAKLSTQFLKYQKCEVSMGKTRKFKGISPLDTAKYILKARKALS